MLVTPDLVEQAAINVLHEHHKRHLAALERQRGLAAESIETLATIGLLAGAEDPGFRYEELPAVFVGCLQLAGEPVGRGLGDATTFDMTWRLEVHVVALGGGEEPQVDAMQRARFYAATVLECLAKRLPRSVVPHTGGERLIGAVTPLSLQFEAAADPDGGHLAHGEANLDVEVPHALTTVGGPLEIEDPDDPYVVPAGPFIVTDPQVDVAHDPLT